MALTRVRLNAQEAEDFSILADAGPEKLRAVSSVLEQTDRPLLTAAELRQAITQAVGEDSAGATLRQLVGFGLGIRRKAFTIETVDVIAQALRERNVSSSTIEKWEKMRDIFKALLVSPHITQVVKSVDLSFDYANLFHGVRVITDCRPVFDDAHAAVIGSIVRHILRLSYTSSEGRMTSLSLAIDRKDIEELQALCGEALKKEATVTRYLADPHHIIKITPGDERDQLS